MKGVLNVVETENVCGENQHQVQQTEENKAKTRVEQSIIPIDETKRTLKEVNPRKEGESHEFA